MLVCACLHKQKKKKRINCTADFCASGGGAFFMHEGIQIGGKEQLNVTSLFFFFSLLLLFFCFLLFFLPLAELV